MVRRLHAEALVLNTKALSGDVRALKQSRMLAHAAGVFAERPETSTSEVDGKEEAIIADFIARRSGKHINTDEDNGQED